MNNTDGIKTSPLFAIIPRLQKNSSIRSTPTFTKFPMLQTELRLKIWELASRNENPVRLTTKQCSICEGLTNTVRYVPVTLSVNWESRLETLRHYSAIRVNDLGFTLDAKFWPGATFFNPQRDLVWTAFDTLFCPSPVARKEVRGLFDKVETLVVCDVKWSWGARWDGGGEAGCGLVCFKNLRKLYLIENCIPEYKKFMGTKEGRVECEVGFRRYFEFLKMEDPEYQVPEVFASPWRELDRHT